VQMRINALQGPATQSRFPYVAIEVLRGHADCNRWIGPPIRA